MGDIYPDRLAITLWISGCCEGGACPQPVWQKIVQGLPPIFLGVWWGVGIPSWGHLSGEGWNPEGCPQKIFKVSPLFGRVCGGETISSMDSPLWSRVGGGSIYPLPCAQ